MIYRVPCVLPLTYSYNVNASLKANLYCLITFPVGHAVSHPSIPDSEKWVKTTKRCRVVLDELRGFFHIGTGGELHRSQERVKFAVGSFPCSKRIFSGNSGFLLSPKTNIPNSNYPIEQFSVDCTLIDHRNDVRMFKTQWNHELQASCFAAKWSEKRKTNCATITLFSLSVLLLIKGFDQSAFEKSLSYCKVWPQKCIQLVGDT